MQMKTYTHKIDTQDLTQRIFANIDLLLNSFDLEFNKKGKSDIYLPCPIHGGDNITGVSISVNKKQWRCWTHDCHAKYGGNIFGFVQGLLSAKNNNDASFKEALMYVANLYGSKKSEQKAYKQSTNNIEFANIVKIIQNNNEKNAIHIEPIELEIPSQYFLKRGFKEETLIHFGIGESNFIKNRAMIPIQDYNGDLVGYIGRATKTYTIPKFIFSNGINKTEHLYNYHRALPFIKNKNAIILVEGQGDVWKLYESGVNNVVGCFGKDPSKKQIQLLLKSGATNLIVLLDDDEAGRESKFKLQRELYKLFKIKFPNLIKKDAGDLSVEEIHDFILPQIKGYY